MLWDVRDDLTTALGVWRVRRDVPVHVELGDVAQAAARALARGDDSPALRELAGLTADACDWQVDPLVDLAVEELGLALELRVAHAPADFVRLAAGRALDGAMTPRELASWAHDLVGYGGPPAIRPLVDAEEEYQQLDELTAWTGDARTPDEVAADVTAIDDQVLAAARALRATPL